MNNLTNKQLNLKNELPLLLLLFFSMLYVTLKVICNPLFFRQIEFTLTFINYSVNLTGAAFVYSFIYIISDIIVLLSNRRYAIFIILFGIVCDGLFSYIMYFTSTISTPPFLSNMILMNTLAVNTIGANMWSLFYHGLLAASIAAVAELLIFSILYKKIHSFFVSTVTSVIVTLISHNLFNDYFMLKDNPEHWGLIIHNLTVNIIIMVIYATIISTILFIKAKILPKWINS